MVNDFEINLFPWREYTELYQKKITKKIVLTSIIFSLLIIFSIHSVMIWRNQYLQKHIEKLQETMHTFSSAEQFFLLEKKIRSSKRAMKNISRNKNFMKNLFVALGKPYEKSVCLTEMKREENRIIFYGFSRTAIDLTEFLKTWPTAYLFSEIKIDELQYQPDNHLMQFQFHSIVS